MARLSRLYAPRVPQLVQARLARPLAPADAPAPAEALDKIASWLAEAARAPAGQQHQNPGAQSVAPAHAPAGQRGIVSRDPASLPGPSSVGAPAMQTGPGGASPAAASPSSVSIHAWAVLPDRITLLATPGDAQALPRLMQALGRRMGSGLLRARVYAGRYHNALLEPGRWVLPAMIWVESLAVATGQVSLATQWPWSSANEHTGLTPTAHDAASGMLRDHPDYWREGDTPFARQAAWRKRLADGLPESQGLQIEAALHGQWALGEKIFLSHLGRLASRRVSPAPRGRPRKVPPAQSAT